METVKNKEQTVLWYCDSNDIKLIQNTTKRFQRKLKSSKIHQVFFVADAMEEEINIGIVF